MKKVQNLTRMLFLGIFVLGTAFASTNVEAQTGGTTKGVPMLISAQSNYQAGALLKIKNRSGAAVYQIDSNGKKHVFPDQKTFMTWHDNFNEVIEVDQEALDSYEDGGPVTIQPGASLLTTMCTKKVYAAGDDGEIVWIADEATAIEYYGKGWSTLVKDVDCGMFSATYKVKAGAFGEVFPDGTYMQDADSDELYLLEGGLKRKVAAQVMKNLTKRFILRVRNINQRYNDGEDLDVEEEGLAIFDPGAGRTKALICHKGERTLRVSSMAVAAHLAHGSTEGPCDSDTEEPVATLPICDHNGDGVRNLIDVAKFAQCQNTFDANGDGAHTLADVSLYAKNNQNNNWCTTNFVCKGTKIEDVDEVEVEDTEKTEVEDTDSAEILNVCDHNGDGVRNLSDVSLFAQCADTFDADGNGLHNLNDMALYGSNNQDDDWCATNFVCEPAVVQTNSSIGKTLLSICDHNADGVRNLSDVALFAGCNTTFDGNGDGVHDLADVSLYASYNQDNNWCNNVFACVPADVSVNSSSAITADTLPICDHNGDGVRNLSDVSLFASCRATFDANGDGVHGLTDLSLYASYNQSDTWCSTNFVCNPVDSSAGTGGKINVMQQ